LYDIYQGSPSRTATKQLQHARKALIDARNNSYQNRQYFLDHIQCKKIDAGQTTQASVINQIQQAERRKFCWNTFKLLRKGPQTSGGLTHILISADNSNPTKQLRVQNKIQLDSSLLQRNIDHVRRTYGTPFTTNQLTEYIGEDGCNANSDEVLQGNVQPNLPKFVTLLLQQFHQQHKEPIEIQFTFEDMCNGFMKWRERTTTSPSGKHLGIYRTLIQTIYHHNPESD
jgi:hypothetical protein